VIQVPSLLAPPTNRKVKGNLSICQVSVKFAYHFKADSPGKVNIACNNRKFFRLKLHLSGVVEFGGFVCGFNISIDLLAPRLPAKLKQQEFYCIYQDADH